MDDKNEKIETKYNALKFDMVRFAKPANECFKKQDGPFQKLSPINRSYKHEDYGLYTHDDRDALSHAAGILQQLSKRRISDDALLQNLLVQLDADYENYMSCFRFCNVDPINGRSPKQVARKFTELMLYYHRSVAVYLAVNPFYFKDLGRDDVEVHEEYFPDFYDLFLRAADYEMYSCHDRGLALLFYNLLSVDSPFSGFLPEDQKAYALWEKRGNAYLDILHSAPVTLFDLTPNSKIQSLRVRFNHLIPSERRDSMQADVFYRLDDFFEVDFSSFDPDDLREYFLMVDTLLLRYMIPLLYLLWSEPLNLQKTYIEDVLAKRSYLVDYELLFYYARTIRTQADYLRLLDYAAAAQISRFLLYSLSADDSADKVVYYTALDNFAFMLPDHCKDDKADRCGKLTIMHLSYMNDPNEGKMLQKALYRKLGQQPGTERTDLSVPYVFLKSFSPHLDYLPMWEMYGGKAQGCCVVLDWKKSLADSTAPEVPLYRVCYLRHANNTYHITQNDNPKLNDLPQFKKWFSQLRRIARKSGIDRKIFNQLLGALLYLFKDSSYSYEREYRIIYAYPKAPSDKILLCTAQTPPKFFVQPDFHVQIDELILGPKFQNISDHIPYLQRQLEEMAEKTGKDVPKITLSNIDYR